MKIVNRPVTSREYKLMLNVGRFTDRAANSQEFLQFIEQIINDLEGKLKGDPEEKERRMWYLDTPQHELQQNKFVLRLRYEKDKAKFKLTLKHRNPDRYLATSEDVCVSKTTNIDKNDIETKFEEDIVRDFGLKFSHSTSILFSERPNLETMADVLVLFPGIASLGIDAGTSITNVCDFEALKIQRKSGKIDFGSKPNVKPCLSF